MSWISGWKRFKKWRSELYIIIVAQHRTTCLEYQIEKNHSSFSIFHFYICYCFRSKTPNGSDQDLSGSGGSTPGAGWPGLAPGMPGPPLSDRPHTISTAYDKGHQRPALQPYTFNKPERIREVSFMYCTLGLLECHICYVMCRICHLVYHICHVMCHTRQMVAHLSHGVLFVKFLRDVSVCHVMRHIFDVVCHFFNLMCVFCVTFCIRTVTNLAWYVTWYACNVL